MNRKRMLPLSELKKIRLDKNQTDLVNVLVFDYNSNNIVNETLLNFVLILAVSVKP